MRIFVLIGVLFALATPLRAEPNFPAFSAPVVDAANMLDDGRRQALDAKLLELQRTTKIQFAVATVPSLEGEEIEPYANALFRRWGIGQKGVDNGLLLLIAPRERKIRFEVGYGLEGTLTDIQSKLIIANEIAPKLKAGDAGGAVQAGVDAAIRVIAGPVTPASRGDAQQVPQIETATPQSASDRDDVSGWIPLIVVVLFVALFIVTWRRNRQAGQGGTWSSGGSSDSGTNTSWSDSSSSSGSDFSGGGGGDSGGGGASGSY